MKIGDDYIKSTERSTLIKNGKSLVKKELIEKYKFMGEEFERKLFIQNSKRYIQKYGHF